MGASRTDGRIVVQTPCKINSYLGVHAEKDERGYHRVGSLMIPVELFDTVNVGEAPALEVVHEPALEVAPEHTTVWRAATLLAEELGVEPQVRIEVEARIPERAGLGGSSADAGATLRALSELWGVEPTGPRVVAVARQVGADVPFFLDPRPGYFAGAGDVLERSFDQLSIPVALVMPVGGGISTKECYDEFDRSGEPPASPGQAISAVQSGLEQLVGQSLSNNLAPAAIALEPEIGVIESWLRLQSGVVGAQVTGSGSCSFALCDSQEAADRVARLAREEHGWRSWSTKTGIGL